MDHDVPESVKKFRKATNKKLITVLSIDGGGVRSIIPAIILEKLEKELQVVDKDENAKLANYFDVITGTGTGGVIAAMLTKKDPESAKNIVKFCMDEFPNIYPQRSSNWFQDSIRKPVDYLWSPKYNSKSLQKPLQEKFGDTRLHETITNLVIPAFDIKSHQPVIFSSFKVTDNSHALNPKLSDICIGGSSTPTYFPSHKFGDYNLIDGGIVNTNPSLAAMIELSKEADDENLVIDDDVNDDLIPMHDKRLLVISLGCGRSDKHEKIEQYDAEMTSKWGPLQWITNKATGSTPIIDCLFEAGAKVVDHHNKVLFESIGLKDNYFRIQVDLEKGNMPLDLATSDNLKFLAEKGEKVYGEAVSQVDPNLFKGVEFAGQNLTKADVLRSMAERLSNEKKHLERSNWTAFAENGFSY